MASAEPADQPAQARPAQEADVPAYSLPAAKLQRAETLDRDENWLWAIGTLWAVISLLLVLGTIVTAYIIASELAKAVFYKRVRC